VFFTASGIVNLCERPCGAPVESGLQRIDDTRCCKKHNFDLKMSIVLLETCRGI
jgi:hypothetical protein